MTEDQEPLTTRLERLALMAETANHHIDNMRVMPAAGAADLIYEAMFRIQHLEGALSRIAGYDIQGWAINALKDNNQ